MAKSLKLIVESILFSSDKPLTVREIQSCLPDAQISEIKSALKVLKYEYEAMGRSFELKEVAQGYQFRSRAEFGSYILRLLQSTPNRLSRASMETLAIVAYKQPILRHEIERLRGVDVGGILKTLLEKGLVRIMGRKDLPGRPLIYGTTKRFLEVFDLKDISSLPKLKESKSFGDEFQPTTREGAMTGEETEDAGTDDSDDNGEPIQPSDIEQVPEPEGVIAEGGPADSEETPETAPEDETGEEIDEAGTERSTAD